MIAKLHTAITDVGETTYIVEVRPRAFPSSRPTWFDARGERLRLDADGRLRGQASGVGYRLCEDLIPVATR